jgi:hypothetical protein
MRSDRGTIDYDQHIRCQSACHEAALTAEGIRFDGVRP